VFLVRDDGDVVASIQEHKEVKYNGHAATVDSYFEQPNAPSSSEENATTHRR
jgi:hypothetical protein